MRSATLAVTLAGAMTLAGCATTNDTDYLIYAKSLTFGASATTTGNASPELSVGLRSQNVAIVPVKSGDKLIQGSVGSAAPQDQDALSVLGQFNASTTTQGITLGEFFSTGVASQKLADGFACAMGDKDGKKPKEICD